jgi:hypothetical protein
MSGPARAIRGTARNRGARHRARALLLSVAVLRISPVEAPSSRVVLRLEGRIIGPWVAELRRACETVLDQPGARLTLDLAGVTFLDPEGVALVRRLLGRQPDRVAAINGSPFVTEQLRGGRSDRPADAGGG